MGGASRLMSLPSPGLIPQVVPGPAPLPAACHARSPSPGPRAVWLSPQDIPKAPEAPGPSRTSMHPGNQNHPPRILGSLSEWKRRVGPKAGILTTRHSHWTLISYFSAANGTPAWGVVHTGGPSQGLEHTCSHAELRTSVHAGSRSPVPSNGREAGEGVEGATCRKPRSFVDVGL